MESYPSMWPQEYVCPISRSVMADPVIVSSGHTYERRCIEIWLGLGQTVCVKQKTRLIPDYIIPNIALRDAIANFAISKGINAVLSPPSPAYVHALANELILELQASGHLMQPSDLVGSDVACIGKRADLQAMADQTEREESAQVHRDGELEGERNMSHRLSAIGIRDKQKQGFQQLTSAHMTSYRQRDMASRERWDTIGHRKSDDVQAVTVSGEQRQQAHSGYNDEYNTADMTVLDRYLENFDMLRVSKKQWGGVREGDMDLRHRNSDSGRQNRVSRDDGYSTRAAAAREGKEPVNRQHDDARGFRAVSERRKSDDVQAVTASGEQTRQAHSGYNDGYNTSGISVMHRHLENLDRLRVSGKQGGGTQDTYREIHGAADLMHRNSNSGGQHRVFRDDRYDMCTAAAREGKEPVKGQFDDARDFRAVRDQRQAFHDDYNRDNMKIAESFHTLCNDIEGLQVLNEERDDSSCTASDKDGQDVAVDGQSDDVDDLMDLGGRSKLHHHHDRCPETDDLLDAYGKYSRRDDFISPSRYFHSASGEVLLRRSHGGGELPLNLVTKPFSYSTEAPNPLVASLPASCTASSFIEELLDPYPDVHTAAIMELRELTRAHAESRISLCCTSLIHALLPHLKSESSILQINGVAVLLNLSVERQNKVMIVRSGAVPYLVEVLKHGVAEAQEHAAGAIFSLALEEENKDPIGVLNAIPPLVRLLHSGPPGARQDAAMALYQLSLFHTNRRKLLKLGAVPILLHVADSEERLDLVGRVLLIVSNIAAIPEGRTTLLEHNAISTLVNLLAVRSDERVPEQAVAALLLLSKGGRQFKTMASFAGAQELLTVLAGCGTVRARKKALALLAIMKESSSAVREDMEADDMLSKQYLRRNKGRVDGIFMNSSAF